ncbi:Mitochondrial carrier domain-containing protein [Cynara cardunculus var. scolymus]|uniref:Mitochondrial carrier domain-containing protein n=1 Tax=Cynara cardunculus var. scolymus TaxID=59895 RepID=A0A103YN89_CYNCS|nr:Mitochondrial carrier domain-containing protein [Cynara cardunculus var. scolymus]
MEAQVGVSSHGGVVDGSTAVKFLQKQQVVAPATASASSPRHHQQSAEIGTVPQLLAGGIAGAFSKTCTAPLARLTILFQVQGMHSEVALLSRPCIWNEASRIANEEGFRAFWKGNLVTIAHRLPYTAVNFYAYEQYKKLLKSIPSIGNNSESAAADACVHFVGGGMSGITAAMATYPLDLVRTRLAAQRSTIYYQGIGHALSTICREEGFFGLPNDSTVMVSLTCGSLSGIASSTATFPLDLVRRRKQLEGVGGRARVYNTGLVGTFGHIVRSEGFRGLYRGILPEFYKVVPGVGIVFMTYETLKKLLSEGTF